MHQGRTTLSSTTARSSMRTVRKYFNSAEHEVFAACSVERGSCVHYRTMSDEGYKNRCIVYTTDGLLEAHHLKYLGFDRTINSL